MKIAVVGTGALGSYYGARLLRHGEELHFLLRSDYNTVKRCGVKVISPEGNFNVRPRCAQTPEDIGECDLVLIGLKTTANDQFPKLLPPLVGARTAILSLQNGLGNVEALGELFGEEKVLGGLCFVCINRPAPGVIDHQAYGKIVLGELNRWPEPRTHDFCSLFKNAGVPCLVTDDLRKAQWEKLVWNIPFNGLGVAGMAGHDAVMNGESTPTFSRDDCLPTDELLADPRWSQLVRELMLEVSAAAHALNLAVSEDQADKMMRNTASMGAYRASTLIDFERGLPLELNSLFLEPLRLACEAGVPTPRLAALCRTLCGLDAARKKRNLQA
jgi:2-dehydropantoate 2-reductase